MSEPSKPKNDDESDVNIAKDSFIPSFLSPVGEASSDYDVALDEEEMMAMSPLTPSVSAKPLLNKYDWNRDRSRNSQSHPTRPVRHDDGRNDYEANYGIDNDEYIYNMANDNGSTNDDLSTPLLDYNYQHQDNNNDDDDDDDDRYHHQDRHDQQRRPFQHQYYQYDADSSPRLNGLNYLNVIAFALNVFTSYFIGVRGVFKLPKRNEIFKAYLTLVTPADWAYWLWTPILIFEFFFTVAQLFPHYRARPIIQQGTGVYFFWACIIQTIWTVLFAKGMHTFCFVAVVLALLCLVFLLASQHYNCLCAPTARGRGGMTIVGFLSQATIPPPRQRRKSLLEYWFFRFPFYLHCGWLLVCMVVQFSIAFRFRFTHSSGAQLTADIVALGVMLPPATFFLTGQSSGPDFVIPIVILWSYIAIAVRLHTPTDTLVELYGHAAIIAVQNASYIFAGLIGVMLVPRIVVWIAQEFCTIGVVELDDEEEDIGATMNEVRLGISSNGLFQRFSLRRGIDANEQSGIIIDDPTDPLTQSTHAGDEEIVSPDRRRHREEEVAAEEENEEDEEQFEDCHENENANRD
mmetsp:Transcript_27468/g.64402  ORF Transcript_27468/g.64402 Transcript_27468/m.64402 type:complete len:574 (-) Transcript_27468:78-1799(-)